MTLLWRVVATILILLGGAAAMADELVDVDPKSTNVVLTSPEFSGLEPRVAKRRAPASTPGAAGLEYLVFSDDVRVAVVNHQWAEKSANWPEIDLIQYLGTVNPGNPMDKKVGASAPYARGEAAGRLTLFSMQDGAEGMACVAYDIKAGTNRLTGFMCVPGTAELSPTEAARMVNGLGIKGVLLPG